MAFFVDQWLRLFLMISDVVVMIGPTKVAAATTNPMRYLNMNDHKGCIKSGFDADIVVLEDD